MHELNLELEVEKICAPTPCGLDLRGFSGEHIENDIFLKSFAKNNILINFQKYGLWGDNRVQIGSKGDNKRLSY